jgi:hypothetical protein
MGDNSVRDARKSYLFRFHETLDDYLQEKLKIEKLKVEKSVEGRDLSETDNRRVKANDKNKVKVLNNHVFRSMANLIHFFEFINNNHELQGVFDNDIEDLFGFRGSHVKRRRVDDSKYLVFLRFLDAILTYDNSLIIEERNGLTYTERRVRRKGFDVGKNIRLQLISGLVDAALESIQNLAGEKEGEMVNVARLKIGTLIEQDLKRTRIWRDYYCTSQIVPNTNHPHRKIGF